MVEAKKARGGVGENRETRYTEAGFPIRSRSLHASLANSLLPGGIGPQRGFFSHQVLRIVTRMQRFYF